MHASIIVSLYYCHIYSTIDPAIAPGVIVHFHKQNLFVNRASS